jgi:hypothetical protein
MVTALIAVWCTLLAVAPPRRPLALGVVAYLCGWVVSELPFAAFCYVLVSTLLDPSLAADLRSRLPLAPDYLIDVKKVIAWAREHAREHGGDPALVFVAGSSSGAQLAALAAFTPNDPAYQPGFERADTSVSAAI